MIDLQFSEIPVGGHAQMTSAERGREGGTQILTVGGGGCVISIVIILTRGGEGVKNPENLADVICEWPLSKRLIPFFSFDGWTKPHIVRL